ncbi:class A beta-lactamase-related serine hydrolase [Brevibacterium casei]|uniref:serine hydrolase n=1 Tax=Brevibacterium casei TaxID=33889 RepID=UPI00223B8AC0|nr:serine hydrolase [Brevibacterium casei]MCT2358885.1 class A beta-lactamase-related serine hydrolase [Brevibacterium casei]
MSETVIDEINGVWTSLGAQGFLFAEDLETHRSVGIRESARIPLASVGKVAIVAGLLDAAADGVLDLTRRVVVDPTTATPGGTGISGLHDPVEMSLRDLAAMALSVSDNAAADTLFALVGPERITALLHRFGIRSFDVVAPMSHLYDVLAEVAGGDEARALAVAVADARSGRVPQLPDSAFNTGTVRATARLFELIHTGRLLRAENSAVLRDLLRRQIFRHRIAAGFPMDAVSYYGKTGTFLNFRHEAGVIVDSDGTAYSIAIFTRSTIATFSQPELDASIGYCARLAIEHLRSLR